MDGTLLAITGARTVAVDDLASRLGPLVVVCDSGNPIAGIRTLAFRGARRIVVLSLPLTLAQDDGSLGNLVRLASQRYPFLTFHLASKPGWLDWADALREAALDLGPVVLTASMTGDPVADSNLARLVGRHGEFSGPGADGIAVPWPDAALTSAVFLDRLRECHARALQDDTLQRPDPTAIAARHNAAEDDAALRELDRKINELLPPMYQERAASAQSMGSAQLLVDSGGAVAWDRMWTSFCDLAMAGGPSHRGTLLEAVSSTEALGDEENYARVVAEIERGIRLATHLPIVKSKNAGWVGVRCDTEEMATWLLRAIIVENVMVRREGDVLYLPAGPGFRLEREIKNVVTAVAKTCHYWMAHKIARAPWPGVSGEKPPSTRPHQQRDPRHREQGAQRRPGGDPLARENRRQGEDEQRPGGAQRGGHPGRG